MFNTPFVLSFALLLSLPILFLVGPRFLPPKHLQISLPDEIDDLALFRRATLASLRRPGSVSRLATINPKPKIAFLFLTNTDLHFSPLWQLFFEPNPNPNNNLLDSNPKQKQKRLYNIYVHADPSSKVTPPGGVFEGRFITAKRTERSSPTLISAARRLLATALLDDPLNSYFALISQSCIPLHSFNYVYKTLFELPPPATESATESTRYPVQKLFPHKSFIEILSEEPQLWDRYIARGKNVMLPEIPFERFRVGSQFFVLSRTHALTVVKDRRFWRKFRLPCLNIESCYPEEHYFPTLLSMEDPKGLSEYTLTRVNWTGSVNGHPHTYRPDDVSPQLIHQLRDSNSSFSYFFARKFSPDCLPLLMDMAKKVIFRE